VSPPNTGEKTDANADAEGFVARLVGSQKRQANDLLADILRMRGLMPLLMKHRNGGRWTRQEKAELLTQLRILSRVSPALLLLLLPGSALLLPAYAWWLDRRRRPRAMAIDKHR
jgi:hypothetical protein